MRIGIVSPFPIAEISNLLNDDCQGLLSKFASDRGISIASYVRGLLQLGHEITVITSDQNLKSNLCLLTGNNLKVYVLPKRERARQRVIDLYRKERRAICNLIDTLEVDIIHAHWTYEYAYASLQTKKPTLITAHDAPLTILRYLHNLYWTIHVVIAFIVRIKSKDIAFVSPSLLKQWKRQMLWKGNSFITPNSTKLLRESAIVNIGSERCIAITDVGSHKNTKKLLKAWSKVLVSNPNAQLDLIGYGTAVNEKLYMWANLNQLNKNINWIGFLSRSKLEEHLLSSDILITPSLSESFGLTAMEAMSAGIPVIGGINSGGIPYVVDDAGLLVDVKSSKEIANGIVTLLNSPKLRLELGNNGIQRVRKVFSTQIVCSNLESIYQFIINRARNL